MAKYTYLVIKKSLIYKNYNKIEVEFNLVQISAVTVLKKRQNPPLGKSVETNTTFTCIASQNICDFRN